MGDVVGSNPEHERRATVRLVHYWLSLCRSNAIPAFVDFDPHRNPIAWDRCVLAFCAGPTDVALEHVGETLAALDAEAAKTMVGGAPVQGLVARILSPLPEVIAGAQPRHHDDIYSLPGVGKILFRSVLLPFRSVSPSRHYILGAATFRIDPLTAADRPGEGEPASRPAEREGARPPLNAG
jgi:hypothetical protein